MCGAPSKQRTAPLKRQCCKFFQAQSPTVTNRMLADNSLKYLCWTAAWQPYLPRSATTPPAAAPADPEKERSTLWPPDVSLKIDPEAVVTWVSGRGGTLRNNK